MFARAFWGFRLLALVAVACACGWLNSAGAAPQEAKQKEKAQKREKRDAAAKDAAKKANPILLEPIMKVEVTTPDEYQGDLLGDLNRRRGKIVAVDSKDQSSILRAEVPLADMFGYATAIRSLSKGRAAYSMEPFSFEQVPNSIVEKILDTAKNRPAARS